MHFSELEVVVEVYVHGEERLLNRTRSGSLGPYAPTWTETLEEMLDQN